MSDSPLKAFLALVETDAKRQFYNLADRLFPGPPKALFFDVDAAVFELVQRQHPHPPSLDEWKKMAFTARLPFLQAVATRRQGPADAKPAVSEPLSDTEEIRQRQHDGLEPEARAIGVMYDLLKTSNRLPTQKAIAEVLGVTDRTLRGNGYAAFRKAWRKERNTRRSKPRAKAEKRK